MIVYKSYDVRFKCVDKKALVSVDDEDMSLDKAIAIYRRIALLLDDTVFLLEDEVKAGYHNED